MFVISEPLKKRIEILSQEVMKQTNQKVYFEEYIALPYFGYIVLRFNLKQEEVTVLELDAYEKLIYDIVGDEFLIDFMGEVYEKVGVKIQNLDHIHEICYSTFKDETLEPSIYAKHIQEDAQFLLKKGKLDKNIHLWEIQIEEDELNIFILGKEFKKITSYPHENYMVNIFEANKIPCFGCMRAVIYAKRNQLSVGHVLLTVEKK